MSGSDRSDNAKIGLKRWLWPAIIFAVAVLALGGVQHRLHYEDAARNAASYARDAQYQIAAECRVPVTTQSCTREIEQARRANQRDEYDLYAQKAMALWTGIMGSMAVVGIALSGVGVYLIWRTWDATREAADNSRKTLAAYIAKERAILKMRVAQYVDDERIPGPFNFYVKIVNLGDSPAHLELVLWEYLNEPVWPKSGFGGRTSNTVIPAKGEGITEMLTHRNPNSSGPYLAIHITYRTVEDGPFASYAAFRITHHPADGYGPESWSALPTLIEGMPDDS